jgi:LemA protein
MVSGLILLAIVVVPIVTAVSLYNGLVTRRNGYRNAYGQIDVQVKRRHDLVPNLVATAREYLRHERETLDAVIRARSAAATAADIAANRPGDRASMERLAGAEATLSGSLSRLLAVAESYPDLKANATMAALMEELSSTENRIAFSRQAYNDSVMEYNTAREKFPAVLVANSLGFDPAAQYEAPATERAAVQVSF